MNIIILIVSIYTYAATTAELSSKCIKAPHADEYLCSFKYQNNDFTCLTQRPKPNNSQNFVIYKIEDGFALSKNTDSSCYWFRHISKGIGDVSYNWWIGEKNCKVYKNSKKCTDEN